MPPAEPRAARPRGIAPNRLVLWLLTAVVAVQSIALVAMHRRVEALQHRATILSGAAQLQLLTPATLLLASSPGETAASLENLQRTRAASHAWLDGFIQQQGIGASEATLLRALHDRFLGQRAEASVNGAIGIYQPQDVAQLHATLRDRYAMAARSVLGEDVAAALMQGIDQQLPGWEPRP